MLPVLQHALAALKPYAPDCIVLLQPTSPLRTAEHIDAAIHLLIDSFADTVVSVVEVPHQFNPVSVMYMTSGILSPFLEGPEILNRQEKPRLLARNGPAVLVTRRAVIDRSRLYGSVVRGIEMDRSDSIDIDDMTDFALAEFWLRRKQQ